MNSEKQGESIFHLAILKTTSSFCWLAGIRAAAQDLRISPYKPLVEGELKRTDASRYRLHPVLVQIRENFCRHSSELVLLEIPRVIVQRLALDPSCCGKDRRSA